jgi:predicted RNA binding protein YcfA (HicA-like mRNA interferase family)
MAPHAIRPIGWRKFEEFVLSCGFEFERQKGSHRVYKKKDVLRPLIIPAHPQDIPVMVIQNNLRTMGVSTKVYTDYWSSKKLKKKKRR